MSTSETLRATVQIPQPVRQSTRLPTAFPDLPAGIFTGDAATRKATAERWNNEVRSWWKTARMAMQQDYEELSAGSNTSINKSNALDSALRTEVTARNAGDATLLQQIQTLVLNNGAGPNRIFLQTEEPTTPTTGDLWYKIELVDGVPKIRPWYYDGAGWQDVRDSAVADTVVALTTEQTARMSGDSALGQRIDAITAVIEDDETGLTAQATALGSLTTQVGTINGTLGSQNTRISSLESTVGNESGGLVAQVNTLANTSVTATEASALAASAISAQLDTGGTIRGAISALDDKVFVGAESLATRVSALEASGVGDLADLTARVGTIEGAYVTDDEAEAKKAEAITAAATYTDGAITSLNASIATNYATKTYADGAADAAKTSAISAAGTYTDTKVGAKSKVFRQSTAPTATAAGDVWYDTANNSIPKVWNGVSWVDTSDGRVANLSSRVTTIEGAYVTSTSASAIAQQQITASLNNGSISNAIASAVSVEATARTSVDTGLANAAVGKYTLNVNAGGAVAGMNITATSGAGTNTSSISFLADSFKIYNSTGDAAPFEVYNNQVYMNSAMIRNLSANVITSGTINAIAITGSTITGASITGTTSITGATINGGTINGATLTSTTFSSGTISVTSGQIDSLTAGPAGASSTTTKLTVNGQEWVTGNLVVARNTTEAGSIYARSIYLGPLANYTSNATSGARATVGSTTDANGEYVVLEVADRNNVKTRIEGGVISASNATLTTLYVGSSAGGNPAAPYGASITSAGAIRGATFYGTRCIGNVNAGMYVCATDGIDVRSAAITESSSFSTTDYLGRLRYGSNRVELLSKGTAGLYFANEVSGDFVFATSAAKRMRFGEYVAGGVGLSIGTITIKDSGGTERKLLVVA